MNATETSQILDSPYVVDLGIFDGFYESWLSRAAAELTELALGEPLIASPEQFVDRALADLKLRLVAVGSRSLIWSYRAAQGPDAVHLFDGADVGAVPIDGKGYPSARYDAHHRELSVPGGRDRLLARLPLLEDLLDRTVRTRLRLVREVVTAARVDLGDGRFGTLGMLREVRASEGDAHNDGRQVAIAVFEQASLVYKPHSLLPDRFIGDLVATLDAAGDDPRDWLAVPTTMDAGDHGWQEFIAHRDCASAAEVAVYYRRCGIWLSLLSAIGTGDIHFENLIAAGSMPYIVDVETLTGWKADLVGDPVRVSGLAELRESVLSTLMLPIRFLGTAADTNLAALGTPDVQTSDFWSARGVVARGCDGIRYLEIPSTYQHGDNLPTIAGQPRPAARYADEITAGYERGLELVSSCQRELRAIVDSPAYDQMPVRQVVRATAIYAAFVDASMHPRYLADRAERRRLLTRLGVPGRLPGTTPDAILDEEIAALTRGDVPLFSARLAERWIRSGNGPVKVAEIDQSPREHMRANLDRHLERAHTRDRHYIHTSLATAATDDDAGLGRWGEGLFGDDDPDTFADAVVSWIDDVSFWDADHTYCQRIGTVADGDNRTALTVGDLTYYGEGGAILFLVERARSGNDVARRLVRGSVLPLEWWPGGVEGQWNPGAFGGLAGTVYLLHEAGTALADRGILAQRDAMVARLRDAARSPELGDDLIGGAAGVAIALAEATRVGVADCREELRHLAPQLDRFAMHGLTFGLAHGRMGVTLARAHLSSAGLESPAAAPLPDPDQIIRGLSDNERDSWCKGVPGVAAAVAAGPRHDGLASLADRLIGRDDRRLPTDISLCHGVAGEIMALVVAGRALESRMLLGEAERRWSVLLRQVQRHGYRGGSPGACGQTGLMAGLTGLAMAGLMLKDPTLPPAYTQTWTTSAVTR